MSHNQRSAESSIKKEIEQLKKGNQLTKNNKLYQLDVFIDADGAVKVGGGLRHSSISDSLQHPIVIPKDHHVTKLIIAHNHEKTLPYILPCWKDF